MITFFLKNNLILNLFIMAIFQLGALVTEIVGSIGGTTFKRQGGTRVMMRKSNGASRSSVLQNKTLGQKAQIFQSWGHLSGATRAEWNSEATKYPFLNTLGVAVLLSGVQFQRKLQIQLSPFSVAAINPSTISSTLNLLSIVTAEIDWNLNDFNIEVSSTTQFVTIACMVEFSNTTLQAPSFVRRGIFTCFEAEDAVSFNVFAELLLKYPFLNDSYNLRIYIYEINASGFVSTQFFEDVAVL
jgi:hypothetical protein